MSKIQVFAEKSWRLTFRLKTAGCPGCSLAAFSTQNSALLSHSSLLTSNSATFSTRSFWAGFKSIDRCRYTQNEEILFPPSIMCMFYASFSNHFLLTKKKNKTTMLCLCMWSNTAPIHVPYLVTSNGLVDFSFSFKELSKEFMCFRIPLLDFKIIWYMSWKKKKHLLSI